MGLSQEFLQLCKNGDFCPGQRKHKPFPCHSVTLREGIGAQGGVSSPRFPGVCLLQTCLFPFFFPTNLLSSASVSSREIFPYLVVVIGLENVLVLTKSVVSTPVDLEVKLRIAQGRILLWETAERQKWGKPGTGRGRVV